MEPCTRAWWNSESLVVLMDVGSVKGPTLSMLARSFFLILACAQGLLLRVFRGKTGQNGLFSLERILPPAIPKADRSLTGGF